VGKQQTNYKVQSATPITYVPVQSNFFDSWPAGGAWIGKLARTWILFFESLLKKSDINPLVGFSINSGATGTNVSLMYAAARAGTVNVCVVIVRTADASTPLTFDIRQNGESVFIEPPTIQPAVAAGTLYAITNLVSLPLPIAYDDVFSIDISSGSTSWAFTAVLQNTPAVAQPGQ
jgi:hypothetical protein